MLTRIVVILAFVAQQLTLPALVMTSMPAESAAASCCRTVERTTCCATVIETECSRTGRACLCAVEPGRSQVPPPARQGAEATELLLALPYPDVALTVARPTAPRGIHWSSQDQAHASHNTHQALLGVWRT